VDVFSICGRYFRGPIFRGPVFQTPLKPKSKPLSKTRSPVKDLINAKREVMLNFGLRPKSKTKLTT